MDDIYDKNTHLVEVKDNIVVAKKFSRYLPSKRLQYSRSDHGQVMSILHWGQRKLFLSELEFLTIYETSLKKAGGSLVVYIGAAAGIHIVYLCKLFPDIKWHLYDPSPFDKKLYSEKNVKIYNQLFTKDDMNKYKNIPTLFISDIRSMDKSGEITDESILFDMELQRVAHITMKPVASMMKFRTLWNTDKLKYLDGKVYVQVWAGRQSTEMRLITTTTKMKTYNNKKIEEQMYYHNHINRRMWYNHDITSYYGHCYDCFAEIYLFKKYLEYKNLPSDDIQKMGRALTKCLTFNKFTSLLEYSKTKIRVKQ